MSSWAEVLGGGAGANARARARARPVAVAPSPLVSVGLFDIFAFVFILGRRFCSTTTHIYIYRNYGYFRQLLRLRWGIYELISGSRAEKGLNIVFTECHGGLRVIERWGKRFSYKFVDIWIKEGGGMLRQT